MKILSYSEIMSLAQDGKLVVEGVEFTIDASLLRYVVSNLPALGECQTGDGFLAIKPASRKDILFLLPDGPPNPG